MSHYFTCHMSCQGSAVVEDFSSVWSDLLVNSVKIDDDGDATDFENENDFETLFYFHVFRAFG